MSLKRLVTLILLVSVMLTGVAPVLAGDATVSQNALAQSGTALQAAVEAYYAAIPAGYGIVKVDDLSLELLENPPFLVDVRNPEELAESGYIEGAVNVPVKELAQHLDLLPADLDTPIVVYCAKGTRGMFGMISLQLLGYTNVRNLWGGFGAWADAGYDAAMDFVEPEVVGPADINADLVAAVDAYLMEGIPGGWGQVSVEDLSVELLEAAPFLLDVREPAELLDLGYIEGAVNIPLREVAANLDQLPTDQPIVIYCKSGWRGNLAAIPLQMLGYDVRNLSGAITAWIDAGNPVEVAEAAFSMEAVIADYFSAIPDGYGIVKVDDLSLELLENPPFLVDVRNPEELAESGYIEGAVNVPVKELAQHLDLLPADLDTPIVVYCAKGTRGMFGMISLQLLGYTNVRNLWGGFGAWADAGYDAAMDFVEPEVVGPADINADLVAAVDAYLMEGIPGGWGQVSVEDLSVELLEAAPFLLDVREPAELLDLGYIEGAVNIPLREVAANLDQLPTDQPIVIYCKSGWRGNQATIPLQMLGYDVRNLSGAITAWIDAGNAVIVD